MNMVHLILPSYCLSNLHPKPPFVPLLVTLIPSLLLMLRLVMKISSPLIRKASCLVYQPAVLTPLQIVRYIYRWRDFAGNLSAAFPQLRECLPS